MNFEENIAARPKYYGACPFPHDYPFSNDYDPLSILKQCYKGGDSYGFIIAVGGLGNALSLAHSRKESFTICVDQNPNVTKVSTVTREAILNSATPDKALKEIRTRFETLFSSDERRGRMGLFPRDLEFDFACEIQSRSTTHWSYKDNYDCAREVCETGAIAIVSADIANTKFQTELRKRAKIGNTACSLLSMTNVHGYVPTRKALRNILRGLPLSREVDILFSERPEQYCQVQPLTRGLEAYMQSVEDAVGSELLHI